MTKQELKEKLETIAKLSGDQEISHQEADKLLLEFIDDKEIEAEFIKIPKWYA